MSITAQPTTVVLENAAFGYGGFAAATDVTAKLQRGDAVALIGPNGSGKSTVLKGLIGLTEHLAGTVTVLGQSPQQVRGKVGVLPQADQRNISMPVTVRQVVQMGLYPQLGALRPFRRAHKDAIRDALEAVDLADRADRIFADLSGGQQQRTILARALVADPQLLLLDEPFNGLDRPNRESLLDLIRELRAQGRTVVVSTHDLEIAREVCSHVMLLDTKMVAFGTLETALTLENLEATFHDTTVDLGETKVTTRHEIETELEP